MLHKRSPALGRGLDDIFGYIAIEGPRGATSALLKIDQVKPCPTQPRRYFREQDLTELANSIAAKGVLQPIVVRPAGEKNYELVAGERRWRAAQQAGLKYIPAMVKSFTDQEVLEIALIENIQRQDLSPLEEAEGYQRLISEYAYTQEKLAEVLGKSRSHVTNYLRLLLLPEKVKQYLSSGLLTAGHARALINHPDAENLADQIVRDKLSVRATEQLGQQGSQPRAHTQRVPFKDPEIQHLEIQLQQLIGLKVSLRYTANKGDLRIEFNSLNDLDNLLAKLSA